MEWVHVVIIIMVKLLLSKSQPVFNTGAGDSAKFRCTAEEGANFADRIRMFLYVEKLEVSCNLYVINHLDRGDLSILSPIYTSMGLIPSIEIFNRTSLMSFKFEKTLVQDMAAWHLEIPREKIITATDVFPGDEWHVKLKVHYGSRLFLTEGTLLDVVREPLLQWRIGVEVGASEVLPVLQVAHTLLAASRLCASDVGIIAPLLSSHEMPNTGIYLLVTRSGFTSEYDQWYDVKPTLCAVLKGACDHISLKNFALINRHLALLTTHGLFISQNLLQVEKTNRENVYLWKTDQCFTDNTVNQEDFLSITMSAFAPEIKRVHTCFYAASPFHTWHPCSPSEDDYIPDIITTVWDRQRNTLIILSYLAYSPKSQAKLTVQRFNEDFTPHKERAFPEFYFPDKSFLPNGMFMYPSTYSLYVFGTQVWYSTDGGISFQLLLKLKLDYVEKIVTCPHNQAVIFVTVRQTVYYTRPGLARYATLSIPKGTVSTLYCDHLGILTNIQLNRRSRTGLTHEIVDLATLIQEDDAGFSRPLAMQFLTDKKVMFFEHISWIEPDVGSKPMFSEVHVGKVIIMRLGGGAEITEVYQEPSECQFLAVAIANILWSFYAEPFRRRLFLNKLLIVKREKIFHLELLDADYGFEADDFEKTLVVPGYSSFLIFRVNSSNLVLAYATMPMLTSYYVLINKGKWFLYDFSSRNGTWSIYENMCSSWTEDSNKAYLNPFIHLDLNDTVKFNFKMSSIKTGAQVFKVTVGNPQLVQIQSESKWDESGVSILNLVITSNFNQRGYTTILVTIPEASLICPITCFAIIVQCSCPAGKMIVYETPIFIKKEDWLHYNEKNEAHENAILKNLPVNYRPPSIFGINLPVSENFYNADPSKPKFRNFYELSKKTGLYKQCEMKKSRKECGCTEAMKLSSFIQYSDCREKVYRVTYPVNDFLLKLYLKKSNQDLQQLSAPYFVLISELNNRTNWVATSTKINPSFDKLRKYFVMSTAMHNPDGLSISLFGSELYHFRITVISGVSFCNLVEEFQIYVDDPPMAYPFHYLVSMITAIGLGTFIMFYFTLQHYWSKFNIKTPCWKFKVHPSPGSKLFKFNK